MQTSQYDVVVVGAGAAGLTAAIGLARADFRVAVVEAAAWPGAENWSGCVYFAENLAHPDILGEAGVESLAWERRLVERGLFATDGHSLLGMKYRDPEAFRHCYTVLRPIYDHHLGQIAQRLGVALLTDTTAESLIRADRRVIGICTQRGPLYAPLVFLAEGDASHLVTREGYERFTDQREAPKFLQGIKQVIELPPGAIEERFGVGATDGIAYEMLVRNGTLRGQDLHLNMGGFLYTNKTSLSVGLVLPVDHLNASFGGDPNLLLEWFENLPALQPWLREGKRTVYGAKIIRGGGARDIPHLIDDGLAIGGAASAIGIDFPYPNFTGPATAMGLLLTQAAKRIRAAHGTFSRQELQQHYLEPLQKTHYWQDVEFLRRWPGYVKKTTVFFGRNLDLALGSAYVWTRPDAWISTKWTNWMRLVRQVASPTDWRAWQTDLRHLTRALRLREVISRPQLSKLLIDGAVNAARDLVREPRAHLPAAGEVKLHYYVAGEDVSGPTTLLNRWFQRFAPVLAAASRLVYRNDTTPLSVKLPGAVQLLLQQINLVDLLGGIVLGVGAVVTGGAQMGWDRFLGLLRRRGPSELPKGLYPRYAFAARTTTDLTDTVPAAQQHWEGRLATLTYETVKASHIHVHWPLDLAKRDSVAKQNLWHLCPAHVYETRTNGMGQVQVVVNFENCIKCETCWRGTDLVDWGRDGQHRFVYAVTSPALPTVLTTANEAADATPALPRITDIWEPLVRDLAKRINGTPIPAELQRDLEELDQLFDRLDRKLRQFDEALAREPRTIDQARTEHLEGLARYAVQLAARIVEVLRHRTWEAPAHEAVQRHLLTLATALLTKAEERARRTWDRRFSWAAADGRQIRLHHLAGLLQIRATMGRVFDRPMLRAKPGSTGQGGEGQHPTPFASGSLESWCIGEIDPFNVTGQSPQTLWRQSRSALQVLFDRHFAGVWRELERGAALSADQERLLNRLTSDILVDHQKTAFSLADPSRKNRFAVLGEIDPSLAYRVLSHCWARELLMLTISNAGAKATEKLEESIAGSAQKDRWLAYAFAVVDGNETSPGVWSGEAMFVPAVGASVLVLLLDDQLVYLPANSPGIRITPLATLGLRGAGLARLELDRLKLPATRATVDRDRILRVWHILASTDLTSVAHGMADLLTQRAIAHATSRVQFPGLFQDDQARDAIGKFGAIKKMIAEMGARRYLIETLDYVLSPTDFSTASFERACAIKAVVAEALGTAPGSVSYNAGQVFGGTGYSEDDILSKYYRDAAAWRFLAQPNSLSLRRHGEQLLREGLQEDKGIASLPNEALLFDQVAQRKALQAELDEVRVLRSRLRSLVQDLIQARREGTEPTGEMLEALGRMNGLLLASKALLLRTHALLELAEASEDKVALLRVWLENVAVALESCEALCRQSAPTTPDRPLVDPAAGPPTTVYADYLSAAVSYDTGDFLARPIDLVQPRYVPEMVASDPALAKRNQELRDILLEAFGTPREGLRYERYVEKQHRPDGADLDVCRKHGFFRLPIAKDLGGEGRLKAEYYLLTTNVNRLVDVGLSLTIQVNTGLGTTPIFLAYYKDLPKALKEQPPFVAETALHQDIADRLDKLFKMVGNYEPKRIKQTYHELQLRLDEYVLKKASLRALLHRFTQAWQQAGAAGRAYDLTAMRNHLQAAATAWQEGCRRAADYHSELGRRKKACELFLRWIASGQISGFALTEPSAGSDTARVATRARMRSVPVEALGDHRYRFTPYGTTGERILLDANRLVFGPNGPAYRYADDAEPAPIRFDAYDYETDDPTKLRYLERGAERIEFHDIAQLRERNGLLWYDYYELTGAKMWITNGRFCGVLCLYAKAEEGVTGFLVDRHLEGLVIGKDEAKMGQHSSPTNEVSLQAVRVPLENVLGLEGRGQVNALETLNVGRSGLAMSAMSQMEGLIEQSRSFARATYGEIPEWIAWRLARMDETRFIAEALAHEVVGRFDHPKTASVRVESAIAKMLVSELWHRVIEWGEEIHGLPGQTTLHLVEKRKRDARILNIYEGTNEVQRFSILRDLASDFAPRWAKEPPTAPESLSREALEFEAVKAELRKRVSAAVEAFGQELWRNPSLQANCFLLAEATAWLKAADSTLYRVAWLDRQAHQDEDAEPSPLLLVGRKALQHCQQEVRQRLRRFDEELAHLRRGFYAPEIRAANLLFNHAAEPETAPGITHTIAAPLSVLVVVEPSVERTTQPLVVEGQVAEPHWTLSAADRSALEVALQLRDQGEGQVQLTVVGVGPAAAVAALREAQSRQIDDLHLLLTDQAVSTAAAAQALATILAGRNVDLVLTGSSGNEQQEGLLGQMLGALLLGAPLAGTAPQIQVERTAQKSTLWLRRDSESTPTVGLPAVVGIEAGVALRPFRIAGYLAGLEKKVTTHSWPKQVPQRKVILSMAAGGAAPAAKETATTLTPETAAEQLLELAGVRAGGGSASAYDGPISEGKVTEAAVIGLIQSAPDGRLQATAAGISRAVRQAAARLHAHGAIVLRGATSEEAERRAVAALLKAGCTDIRLASAVTDRQLLGAWLAAPPQMILGEPGTEPLILAWQKQTRAGGEIVLRARRVALAHNQVETTRERGHLRASHNGQVLPSGLVVAPDVVVEGEVPADGPPRVSRWQPSVAEQVETILRQVEAHLREETGVVRLTEADFIIDVGFGVGNRDGYEAVIDPLEQALKVLGVPNLAIGGSRKVTEELHLLPVDRQIGQSGVRVNPQVLLAIGISGAPQHLDYIGPRAVVLAFNRDPDAPLLTLSQHQARPKVFPIVGDLFETVPAFIAALRQRS